jgi:hypothetical protein
LKIKLLCLLLLASANAATLRLAWDHVEPQNAKEYRIYEHVGGVTNRVAVIPATGANTITGTVENATPGVHVYSVTAANEWGESYHSNTATTRDTNSPPTQLRVQIIVTVE